MKLKKIIFSLLTVVAVGSVATTLITSCSGVSKDILNNMVSLGDETKFADNVGDQSFDLQHEINIALTDKSATDAFKTSVVNKILKGWFDSLTGNSTIDNDKKQWKKDISDEWDSQIQSSKNSHLSNWKYYFQNDVLNPVGGTKAKWEQNQWYSKIRDFFTTEITKNNYLSVPTREDNSKNVNFYPTKSEKQPYDDLVDFNHQVIPSLGSDLKSLLGTGKVLGESDTLNPDWWPTINFYATGNKNYVDGSTDQDKSYALIQQMAFDLYTKNTMPLSTGYVLWNYSLGQLTDLKGIYNNEVVRDSGSTSSTVGDDPATGLLSTPSFAFPFFGEPAAGSWGPNQKFQKFVKDFNEGNQFLDDRDSGAEGKLKLIDINSTINGYSDKSGETLSLISQATDSSSDDTPYETYVAPLLDMLNLYEYPNNADLNANMPLALKHDDNYFPDSNKIIRNFLFADAKSTSAPGSSIDPFPDKNVLVPSNSNAGILQLASIYKNDGTEDAKKIELFNPKSATDTYDWYNGGASQILSAMRIANSTSDPLPYIMIRTAKGVTFQGIDGIEYLKQTSTDENPPTLQDSTWRPGLPYSQERENQLIKFRTVYQNLATTPQFKGISVINSSSGSASGPLVDYLKSNLDDVVLAAVNRVWTTKDVTPDTHKDGTETSYYDDGLLGLKSIIPENNGNDIWNTQLNDLVQSFALLNAYTSATTTFDANNKKLFSWSNTYRSNALINDEVDGSTIYKNGLATPLPISMTSGVSSADNTNLLLAKTNYAPVINSTNASAKVTGLTEFLGDSTFASDSYNRLIANQTSDVKNNGIIDNYNEWVKTLSNDARPTDSKGAGNKKAYQYNYSENILTYNDYVNDMLWKFGGGNTFTNSVKTAALESYMNGWDSAYKTQSSSGDFKDAITSMYVTSKLISSDTPLTSYFNLNGNSALDYDSYKSGLWNEWINSLNNNLGSTKVATQGDVITNGYTDKAIDYDTYLATIYRLIGKPAVGGTPDYKGFIDWLQNKIGSDFQNTAYIAWAARDNEILNPNFSDKTATQSQIYGWKDNYDGLFDNIYQNRNITTAPANKTYTTFDSYWQFAPIPNGTTNDPTDAAMGFLGLQTKNSNTMDKVSTNAKTALFDSFGTSIDSANHYGSLYQFNNGGDAAAARANLVNLVTKDLETPTVARIYQYRDFINNQTGGLFTNSGTDTAIQNATTNEEKRQVLIDAIEKTGEQPADFILPDGCFVGYNKNTNAHGPTYELNYHGSGPIIPDDTTGDKAEGSRVTIMQINSYDANILGDDGKTDYGKTLTHLKSVLGPDLLNYLVAQAALDSSNQTATINDVIRTVFGGNKLVVYDRRFNDQLGSQWVKDWKTKN